MSLVLDSGTEAASARRRVGVATCCLILATAFWGLGFTWGKSAQSTINLAGPGEHSGVGPLLFLSVRFLLAGLIWTALFWRRTSFGWSGGTVLRSVLLGILLGGGMILQHLALDRSTEAVTAFLTTLSIVFVPIIALVVHRRLPHWATLLGIGIALVGMWRLTGGSPRGMGTGEWLGVGCAVVFSIHLFLINITVKSDSPWRMTAGQFVVVGFMCLAVLACLQDGTAYLHPAEVQRLFGQPGVLRQLALMVVLPTIGAFALMMFFQPWLDPTRAALIYLLEPIWASAFAWVAAGKAMSGAEMQGAALILGANGLVELLAARRARR
ncbi:MAG TPA: DMT family transporter [Tepidisphaeraceae bacterium]|nr:DMT family transporter [Tepidisphaeraceae bacterium]